MKKLLVVLLSALMIFTLAGCKKSGEEGRSAVQVDSAADFAKIGITGMDVPTDKGLSNIEYYILDGNIAEVYFINSGHQFLYRASKEAGAGSIVEIEKAPLMSFASSYDGISYTFNEYENGLVCVWIKDLVTYALLEESVSSDSNYEFARVIQIITGINFDEEEEVDKQIELPKIDSKTTKDFIMNWFEENEFKDVDYEYENSDTVEADHVISLSKEGKVYPTDEIVCKISTGPKKPDIVRVPDNMLNYKEEDFLKALKDLGMGATKGSTKYYSTTIKNGNVFCYDDGNFPVGTIVKYNLSRGAYAFDSDDYNGRTKDNAIEYVKELNNLNAHVTLNLEDHETNNHTAGTIYKCSATKDGIKTIVSCRLAKTPSPTKVNLPNYVGTYNNPCGAAASCTLNQINYMIEYHEDKDHPAGYISAQTVNPGPVDPGTCVKLIVSSSEIYLYRVEDSYYDKFAGNWAEETIEALNAGDLGKFNDIRYETRTDGSMPNATVLEIQIFDDATQSWTSNYPRGYYSKYTKVKVIVNDIRLLGSN